MRISPSVFQPTIFQKVSIFFNIFRNINHHIIPPFTNSRFQSPSSSPWNGSVKIFSYLSFRLLIHLMSLNGSVRDFCIHIWDVIIFVQSLTFSAVFGETSPVFPLMTFDTVVVLIPSISAISFNCYHVRFTPIQKYINILLTLGHENASVAHKKL